MTDERPVDVVDVQAVNAGAKAKGLKLYASRPKVYPQAAHGTFRRLKWLVMAVTLAIYYMTPWLRWDRGPYAPDQAVLIDMAHRRFYWFFIEIWPQEFYYVAGLLVMAGVGLFLITSTVGRAWCGYACPQTVWTDLFITVERFFQGDRNARMRLASQPWGLRKIAIIGATHATWILIALLTGGAWIFYFADAPNLLHGFLTGQAPFVAYATVGVLTAATYIFGGIMREQVCIYMCPWPRIQAAMLDEDSLVVTYNDWRGEPRTHGKKKALAHGLSAGDCVDCNACVAVCPMGIDIRHGQQLECITCALCIDACDAVMKRVDRPTGLISYSTLRDYNHNMMVAKDPAGQIDPHQVRDAEGQINPAIRTVNTHVFVRPRTLIYFFLWSAVGLGMLYFLLTRDRLQLNVQHDRNPVFVQLSDGSFRNGYTIKILNMTPEPRTFTLSMDDLPGASMRIGDAVETQGRSIQVTAEPDKVKQVKLFVIQPATLAKPGRSQFTIQAYDPETHETSRYKAQFETPGAQP